MHFKVLVLVLVLAAFCAAHPGEPQSWLSTLFQLVERILGTEMAVKSLTDAVSVNTQRFTAMHEKLSQVQTLTDAVSAYTLRFNAMNEKVSQVKLLENAVSVCINKTSAMELELSTSLDKINSLETTLTKAQEEISSKQQEGTIAFYAQLGSTIDKSTGGQTLVFPTVETNLGNAYSGSTGVFTAPASGAYVFSLTVTLYGLSSRTNRGTFYITQNGVEKVTVVADTYDTSNKYGMASGTTVLVLNKGDDVHVKVAGSNYYIYGGGYTYFSGFLLH